MKKNILYICPSSGLGGAETFLKTTFSYHDSARYSPTYLLFQPGPLSDWLQQNNAAFDILPARPRLSKIKSVFATHAFVQKYIQQKSIDLVHTTMAYGALFSSFAARSTHRPHVWFQHGPASGWMDQVAALLPHQGVLVNSEYTQQKQKSLEKYLSLFLNSKRFFAKIDLGTAPPQVSVSESAELRKALLEKHNLSSDTVIFAMACRLQKWKGVDLVVEAVRKLTQANLSAKFFVVIYGDSFDSEEYVNNLKAAAQGLPVSFAGSVKNVPLAFSACDVIINASLQPEPFGLSIIEALSVGKPVIAPNEGGPVEILQDQKNGLFFMARSAQSLSEKMHWMLENRERRLEMESTALQHYQQHYTAQNMMRQLESVYDKLML
jgi:glycosyltransferase involved in cell wall biosynthesis